MDSAAADLDYQTVPAQEFQFVDEKFWFSELAKRILLGPDRLGRSPVRLKEPGKESADPTLDVLCAAVGFDDPSLKETIALHKKRLSRRLIGVVLIYLIFTGLCVGLLVIGVRPLIDLLSDTSIIRAYALFLLILFLLFFYVALFVVVRLGFRLAFAITATRFADTVCVLTVVHVILELSRDDVLTHPEKRRRLMSRINNLARTTLLLALRFGSRSDANQASVKEHFRHMERYIRERERWAAMPRPTTLEDLRRDFNRLGQIYLSGNYGDFAWPKDALLVESEQTIPDRMRKGLPRFLGIVVPLGLMAYFLWKPIPGVDSKVVALIFLAWLLLGIDAILKLGIVAGVVNLAKEIKTLK